MNIGRKTGAILLTACICLWHGTGFSAAASSYVYDNSGEAIPAQTGYQVERCVDGEALGCGAFDGLHDIFLTEDACYLADTGNSRIVVANGDLTAAEAVITAFTDDHGQVYELSQPEGVYYEAATGWLYVADTGNERVLVGDVQGKLYRSIIRPDTALYVNETFRPQRITTDRAGSCYVLLDNVTNGAAVFEADGTFSGYFGANAVQPTAQVIARHLWHRWSTEEMRAASVRSIASGISSFDMDAEGFFFTVSQSAGVGTERVKKVNPAGANLFSGRDFSFGDLTTTEDAEKGQEIAVRLVDVDVDALGRINCLDAESGHVLQYDGEGNLLFVLGGQGERQGEFSLQPTAIEADEQHLYVTDAMKQSITVFSETSFGKTVHQAVMLYEEGRYGEAYEPWLAVLRQDGSYPLAYEGISAALLEQGNYAEAMDYAELAGSSEVYNKAFQGYRGEWLSAHFGRVVMGVAGVLVGAMGWRYYRRQRRLSRKEQ